MMIRAIRDEGYSPIDLLVQQEVVKQLFPYSKSRIEGQILFVDCLIQDPDFRTGYQVQIQYVSQSAHSVFVRHPKIIPSVAIHMYADASLCLYYPPDISPLRRLWIGKDLIPMTALWICHYEQWQINEHIWMGREAPGHAELLQRLKD